MKKVGILTMHRVINFGSVLQAYATQYILEKLGYDAEFIDYQFPNEIHNEDQISFFTKIGRLVLQIKTGFPGKRQIRAFENFRIKHLRLGVYMPTREFLQRNVPDYDVYLVGSDQTWNTRHIGTDYTFLLDFAPKNKKRVSYASSAARKNLSTEYAENFKFYLSQFSRISVRESNTQELVKKIIDRDVPVCIDPTLLLSNEDWSAIANLSDIKEKIKSPFILVYILKYSFYPYPLATTVIRHVYNKYKLPVVCIRYSSKENLGIKNAIQLNEGISPEDYVWLFQNASFVISTSFHGTAFSVIFRKSFYSIVNPTIDDDRIISFLSSIDLKDRAISTDTWNGVVSETNYYDANPKLTKLIESSISFLRSSIG